MMKKVILFGGSFDPVHIGHIKIASSVYKQVQCDELWFIPALNNPFKKEQGASGKQRLEMLELAILNDPYMKVCDIELTMDENEKSYTINTILKLKEIHKDTKFYYLIGMDQVEKLDQWYQIEKLSKEVCFLTVERPGYEIIHSNIERYHIKKLVVETIEASSSEVRNGNLSLLDINVLKYISKHGLYLETLIKPYLSQKRYEHTLSMTKVAIEIAKSNGIDPLKARIAGLLHDIGKEMDKEQIKKIMETKYPNDLNHPFSIYHQWISSYLAKKRFIVEDQEILKAIECHATADIAMSPLAMCIYCADKLDPWRNYDSSDVIRLCKENIENGFKICLKQNLQYLQSKKISLDKDTKKIYEYYLKEQI